MTALEAVATVFGLACVWLYIRQSIWSWPTGLVQVLLFIWIFYEARLYSDVLLHVIYVFLQVYGWNNWVRGHRPQEGLLPITRLRPLGALTWCGVIVLGMATLGFLMSSYTNADLAYWDAAIAAASLVAQYLLARKILETWLIWIGVDVLAIGVYSIKGLHITTVLYAVFLVLAIIGWFQWRKSYRKQDTKQISEPAAFAQAEVLSWASSSRHTGDTSS